MLILYLKNVKRVLEKCIKYIPTMCIKNSENREKTNKTEE